MAEGERSPRQLLTIGVVGGLIGIYLANYLNSTDWYGVVFVLCRTRGSTRRLLGCRCRQTSGKLWARDGRALNRPAVARSRPSGRVARTGRGNELQHPLGSSYNRADSSGDYRPRERCHGAARHQDEHRHNGTVDDGNRNGSVPDHARFQVLRSLVASGST